MQVFEMPGAAILSIVVHLAYLRRDDLVDALEVADMENLLTDEILKRKEYDLERLEQLNERSPKTRRRQKRLEDAWDACLADPPGAVDKMRLLVDSISDHNQLKRELCKLLGVPLGTASRCREELQERQLKLLELAESSADPVQALAAEALELELDRPSTMASLATWETRGRAGDWREAFRLPSDFLAGQQAVVLIAGAVRVPVEEVRDHWTAIARRCSAQAQEVAAAWADPEQLLADAVTAGGWEALAVAAGVTPDVLQRHYKQLRDGPVSRPG